MENQKAFEREFLERVRYLRDNDFVGCLALLGIVAAFCVEREDGELLKEKLNESFAAASRGELKKAIRRLRVMGSPDCTETVDRAVAYIRSECLRKPRVSA